MENTTWCTRQSFWRLTWGLFLWSWIAFALLSMAVEAAAQSVPPPAPLTHSTGQVCGKIVKKTGELKVIKKTGLPKNVSVRPVCKKNEAPIMDLGVIDESVAKLQSVVGTVCAQNPELTLVTSATQSDACRVYDGKQADCEKSFQTDGSGESTSCWYVKGKCLACDRYYESITATTTGGALAPACDNSCQEPPPACGDASRTIFAGWPHTEACRDIETEAHCNMAYAVSEFAGEEYPVNCFWIDDGCMGCGHNTKDSKRCINEGSEGHQCEENSDCDSAPGAGDGFCKALCVNSCAQTPGYLPCGDAGREEGSCSGAEDEIQCSKHFQQGEFGPVSCYFRTSSQGGGSCNPCSLEDDLIGRCDDSCNR